MAALVFHSTPDLKGAISERKCIETAKTRTLQLSASSAPRKSVFGLFSGGSKNSSNSQTNKSKPRFLEKRFGFVKETIKYEKLNRKRCEIRVLHIEPGHADDPINCHFHMVSLLDKTIPEYDALSYCWQEAPPGAGAASETTPDEPASKQSTSDTSVQLPITALKALVRLRKPDKLCLVWIDAVCINQRDIKERNSQVPLMGLVYRRAARTVAWLGDLGDDHLCKDAVDSLKLISDLGFTESYYEAVTGHLREQLSLGGHFTYLRLPLGCNAKALDAFFAARWHSRAWVQQEVALAKKVVVMIGNHEIEWYHASNTAFTLSGSKEIGRAVPLSKSAADGQSACYALGAYVRGKTGGDEEEDQPLQLLIGMAYELKCANPRDKIYGMLGLTRWNPDDLPWLIQPDYSRSIDDVYRDATKCAIAEVTGLGILSWVQHGQTEDSSLKETGTWVMKFGPKHRRLLLVELYEATKESTADLDLLLECQDPSILRLRGFTVDQVSEAEYLDWDDWVSPIVFIQNNLPEFEGKETYPLLLLRLLRLLSMDCNPRFSLRYHDDDLASDMGSYMALALLMKKIEFPKAFQTLTEEFQEDLNSFLHALYLSAHSRSFFVTREGRMGMGPANVREGDIVAALYGGKALYMLRPNGSTYQYLGDCYVEDLMDGGVLEEKEERGLSDMIYDLR